MNSNNNYEKNIFDSLENELDEYFYEKNIFDGLENEINNYINKNKNNETKF